MGHILEDYFLDKSTWPILFFGGFKKDIDYQTTINCAIVPERVPVINKKGLIKGFFTR
jgi:hypothetical protein